MGGVSEYSTYVNSACSIRRYMYIYVEDKECKMMTYSISKCY